MHIDIRRRLACRAEFEFEFLEDRRVAQEVVCQAAEFCGCGFAAGDDEEGGVHYDFVVGDFVLLLALLEDVPDEVAVLGFGVQSLDCFLGRVAQVSEAPLADGGGDTPH